MDGLESAADGMMSAAAAGQNTAFADQGATERLPDNGVSLALGLELGCNGDARGGRISWTEVKSFLHKNLVVGTNGNSKNDNENHYVSNQLKYITASKCSSTVSKQPMNVLSNIS
jgi:hypothetical protein